MRVVAKRSAMTLFSDARDHYSHRVRIVLAEKGVAVDLIDIDPKQKPEELADLNPYNSLPTLVDRDDLSLYESKVIMEYLGGRVSYRPVVPVYEAARAKSRLWMDRHEREWAHKVATILHSKNKERVTKGRKELKESLIRIAPIFSGMPFFMSDEFTI